jgi:hypothetical protein
MVALSSARPTTLKQSPMRRTVRIYNLFRRRYRARRLGIEFRRGANWVLPGKMFVNSMRWAISATSCANGAGYCRLRWIFSVHARNTYPDAVIHTYEPNPSMKKFLEHQSGIGGFTYFLKAIGNNDDMVFLDRGGGVSPHKVPFSNRAGTLLRWCSIRVFSD